ncbi:MAG: CopG family transcriptional regulator [Hadesarchaea archaeon]|nr:MAG: CopG family transcriptional regulator [Hadesarchaea archaeon]TDA35967.1 MAG: CopG family transcriptional regulator [Hadesarchaea archaeon]
MPPPIRLSVALDKETDEILKKLVQQSGMTCSALIRFALKFFSSYGELLKDPEKVRIWMDLLQGGEHVILDVDHWLLFFKYLERSENREKFYKECQEVSKSHAEQLSSLSLPQYLKRIEACNFFRIGQVSEKEFTLVLNVEASKRFVKELLMHTLEGMGYRVKIKEDKAKLRLRVEE